MIKKKRLSVVISAAVGLTASLAMPALAQDDDTVFDEDDLILEEVIVTGTRIINEDGYGRTSPVTVVGMDEIGSFGYTRVEDMLNNLPQMEVAQNSFVSNGSSGTATLDLRGLGAKRNLVLLNGRRMQPGGVYEYAPDINQIPAQLIERVEVLTGGASATYGADAVAGVINFIMRRVDGIEVTAGISGYQHINNNSYIRGLMDVEGFEYPTGSTGLDGKTYNASIVIGGDFANGRGNATAYATWRENDDLLHGSRDYSSCALNGSGTACGGSAAATEIPNFWIAPLTEDGWGPDGYDYFQEAFLVLQPDSSLMMDDWRHPSNRYNYAPINYYMRPDERWSLGAFVDYEINDHAVVYLETMGFSDRTASQIAESGTFWSFHPLQLSNAYFSDGFRQSLMEFWPDVEDFGVYIGKRNTEGGPRQNRFGHTSFRIVTGLRGAINQDWNYDVSYLYADTSASSAYVNDFFQPNIAIAVDSRLCEPDPGCIPYEVFTYQGVTEEAASNLHATAVATAHTSTTVFQSYVTGTTPWGLPAGEIMAVAGYEYRRVEYETITDTVFEQGLLTGQGLENKSLRGGYAVDELFIESNIPLLADESFARNMTLDLAYRWSDYSTSGPSNTYRAGLDWQVVDWLRIRTGYNHAVRAPNIAEIYEPQQLSAFSGQDPCEGEDPVYTFEQCARSGVTAQQYGSLPANPYDEWGGLNSIRGGNPELDPEEADTLTLGLVFEIGDTMQLSLDYWDVQIEGAIESMDGATALEQCLQYDRLCDLVHRAPGSGSLWRSEDGYVYEIAWNLGELHSRGIDVVWDWSPGTNWQIGLVGSYYLKKETTTIPGDSDTTQDCAGLAKNGGWWDDDTGWCFATPEWRHIASVTYDSESFWTLTGRWRFYEGVSYDSTRDEIADKNLTDQNYFDLSAVFRFMETHDLILGVNNILDEEPPLVGSSLSNNGNSVSLYDQIGRYLFANVTLRW